MRRPLPACEEHPSQSPREKILFSWSGGKDSALALHRLQEMGSYEIAALLTTVSTPYKRISLHGVREELLDQQAESLGLPLHKLYLPGPFCNNQQFEELMGESLLQFRNLGVVGVAHGDIFLQDIREYRERNLARVGLRGIFPLWHQDTAELVKEFMRLGFKAYLSCVEGKLGPEFAGRRLDENLVQSLPAGTDPCGENGEFHSFVHDGPIFQRAVAVKVGETVCRDDRYYADLLPVDVPNSTPSPETLSQERTR